MVLTGIPSSTAWTNEHCCRGASDLEIEDSHRETISAFEGIVEVGIICSMSASFRYEGFAEGGQTIII